jgi:hypothetical protein
MTLVGDAWTPAETPVRNRTLPDALAFIAGVGASFEFNTRGLLVTPGTTDTIVIVDSRSSMTEQITVWPSGQVAP